MLREKRPSPPPKRCGKRMQCLGNRVQRINGRTSPVAFGQALLDIYRLSEYKITQNLDVSNAHHERRENSAANSSEERESSNGKTPLQLNACELEYCLLANTALLSPQIPPPTGELRVAESLRVLPCPVSGKQIRDHSIFSQLLTRNTAMGNRAHRSTKKKLPLHVQGNPIRK